MGIISYVVDEDKMLSLTRALNALFLRIYRGNSASLFAQRPHSSR